MGFELIEDYIAELGLDAAKKHIGDKIDDRKLKTALKEYIISERRYNKVCTMNKECDFQGLVDFITRNMIDEVVLRFFSVNRKEREKVHSEIVTQAVSYSKAETGEAKRRVARIIAVSLEIVRQFFKEKIPISEYLLAADITDAVKENTDETISEAKTEIVQAVVDAQEIISSKLSVLQQSVENEVLYAAENNMSQMIANGQYGQAEKSMRKILTGMSMEHNLYPDYGFTYEEGKLKSVPLTDSAHLKYPEKVTCRGTIRVGDHYFKDEDANPLDYAYRHQSPMVMKVSDAVKFLGNHRDPIQTEAKEWIDKEIEIAPPEFPEALPCAIKVEDKTYFEYILLRGQEILDDGTCIMGNREQPETNIYFEIRLNPQVPESTEFDVNINNATNRELLNYVTFMEELRQKKELHIYVLSLQKDLMSGAIENIDHRTNFSDAREEIDFLKRVCAIEDYFHVQIDVEGEIDDEEYRWLLRISEMVMNDKVEATWKEAAFTGTINDELKKQINNTDITKSVVLSCIMECSVNLFGTILEFQYSRTYKSAVMKDADKLRKILNFIDDGDPVKIKFVPGDNDEVFDTLKISKTKPGVRPH